MDAKNENFVSIKEEWIDDHVTAEPPEEEHPVSELFRLKEEPIDHEVDYNGWAPQFSEVFIKSEPGFKSETGNSESACNPRRPSVAQTIRHTAAKNQSDDDRSDEIQPRIRPCRGLDKAAAGNVYCAVCDYTSSHIGNLKRHVKQHDPKTKVPRVPKQRVYSCELCGYKCAEFSRLKRHLMTHTGEKPLACGVCDFRTSHSNDFQRHTMVHTGEKPYTCDLCVYKSSDVRNLKRHKRTHTGEKPYACDYCRYRSRTSHHMSRHKMMKHKVNPKTSAT